MRMDMTDAISFPDYEEYTPSAGLEASLSGGAASAEPPLRSRTLAGLFKVAHGRMTG